MRAKGLGVSIAGGISFLLVIGMILVNVVVVLLWQQHLVSFQAQQTMGVLNILSLNSEKICSGGRTTSTYLETTCSSLGETCVNVFLYNGSEIISLQEEKQTGFTQDLMKSASSGENIIKLGGPAWGIYSPGKKFLFNAISLNNDCIAGGAVGIVQVLHPLYKTIKAKQGIIFVYILINMMILTTIGFFRISKLVVTPLHNLVKLSENYSDSETFLFTLDSTRNEFSKLSMALNGMLSRIEKDRKNLKDTVVSLKVANEQLVESQKEMIRAEKLAAVGRLSAGLAHEIGNPIGIVQGYLELLGQNNFTEEERLQFSERGGKEVTRINRLVHQLLDLTRPPVQEMGVTAVHEVLKEICEMLSAQKDMEQIDIIQQFNAVQDKVEIGNHALHQVFLNCLLNAIDAIKEKGENLPGTITLISENTWHEDSEDHIILKIQDDGTGIEEEHIDTVFDPFYTSKPPGKGTGLGLSVSNTIIEAAKGRIQVTSKKKKGTSLTIDLPLCSSETEIAVLLKQTKPQKKIT